MITNNYKIVIYGNNIYREQELNKREDSIRVGTTKSCQIRFNKEKFFDEFELCLSRVGDSWRLVASEQIYFTTDGVMKLYSKDLIHGDEITVKYQNVNGEIFKINFFINFDEYIKNYNRVIEINDRQRISIGGDTKCDIRLEDPLIGMDRITLELNNGEYYITDNNTKYGVYKNGVKINGYSSVKDYDYIMIVGYSFYLYDNKLYTSESSNMLITDLKFEDINECESSYVYPKFIRNTRIKYELPIEEIELLSPKQRAQKPNSNIILILAPAIGMLFVTVILRGLLSNSSNSSFILFSVASMMIGICVSIATYIIERRRHKKEIKEREERYREYIEKKEIEIVELRDRELIALDKKFRSVRDSINNALRFNRILFERDKRDDDFVYVNLGVGTVKSANEVKYTKQEYKDTDDELCDIPQQIAQKYLYINNAPIISKLAKCNSVGISGTKKQLYSMLKNITLDISINQFYKDVKLFYIFNESDLDDFRWLRWFGHVQNDVTECRNLVYDEESKNILLEYLYIELSRRESDLRHNSSISFDTHNIIFVFDKKVIEKHPVSKYFESCAQISFSFIFFEQNEDCIPKGCNEIIRLNNDSGTLIHTDNGEKQVQFSYENIEKSIAEKIAIKLAPIYVDEVSLESELTKNITIYELLGIMSIDDLDIGARWQQSKVYKSLAAPLGVKVGNKIVYLDLHERFHGPHGLVAGTTGSGKSEILQTYILSMASLYNPYEVGFVIIDFKGGGMANQFKDLPHIIGAITNIDGREINRSLLSIKAELIKRQEIFSACGVNHINDYIKLYKAQKVERPLPHLIMIVDEFAELKAEHPDFMKEIISAARIGRTLGIHLILATQKPAGVVDNQIWSNSKFKLCLKVQTKEDSNEVIKTPLASEIVEPGRAYFQVGNNEIFELFQSAYSGSSVPSGNDMNEKKIEIYEVNTWGKKRSVYTNLIERQENKETKSQLQAIVDYISLYCNDNGIQRLPGICIPSLEDVIKTSALNYEIASDFNISVPIGIYDDPRQQRQGEAVVELSKENIFIVGSAQTGKTTMLQTIAYGLINKYDPSQVNIYFIDCGNMVLKIFEESAHVGGIVFPNEEEKCRNLFKLLNTMIVDRKDLLSSKSVGNYSAYLDAGYKDIPMVVVIIDNMAAFKEYYPNQSEELNSLSREAQGIGISFVITSANSNALNYRTLANFGKKFVLNCIDTSEYSNAFGHCKDTPKDTAGRGLMANDKKVIEFQTAIFGEGNKEAERNQELRSFISKRNISCSSRARTIPMVPEKLILDQELNTNRSKFCNRGVLPIGMDFSTVEYSFLDLNTSSSLSLLGDADIKILFTLNLMRMLKETIIFHNVNAIVIDDKLKTLQECSSYGFVTKYTSDVSDGLALIHEFCEDFEKKREGNSRTQEYRMLLLNNSEVFKKIYNDRNDSKSFSELIKGASEAGAFVLVTTVENQAISFNSSDVLKTIKEERKAILFASITENRLFDISLRNRTEAPFSKSIGYRFEGANYSKMKVFE